jgi:hypothetical protein
MDITKVDARVSTEDPRSCDAATVTVDATNVDACVSTEGPKKKRSRNNRKRNNKTATKVDACVSTVDPGRCDAATVTVDPTKVDECVSTVDPPRTCDSSTMSMDPTIMCVAYTQTDTRVDGGAAAAVAKEYEHQLKMEIQKIRELEEELAVSKRLVTDLMVNVKSVDQQVRKYAEEAVFNWSDDCECKQQVLAVADLLEDFIVMGMDVEKSDPEATSDRSMKVDCEMQTEEIGRQKNCANAEEQETVSRLEHKNRQLTVLVEKFERKIIVLNEEMQQRLEDRTSHIEHVTMKYEEENQRQLLKMRDMRNELLWYKAQLPGIRMPTWLNG